MSRKLIFVCTLCLVCGAAQASNLLTNPGFETQDFTGWWTWVNVPADQAIVIDTMNYYSGAASAQISSTNTSDGWSAFGQGVVAGPGTYTLSFEYDPSLWAQGGVNVNYDDSGWNNNYGNTWIQLVSGTGNGNTTGWQTYSTEVTAPAGTAVIEVKFTEGGWGTMNVDDVVLSPIPEPATMVLLGIGGLLAIRRKDA